MVSKVAATYDDCMKIVAFLKKTITQPPEIGLVCGSGLGDLGDRIKNAVSMRYADIPGFPVSSVAGHKGMLICGTLGGKLVMCMQGRFHMYEGYEPSQCALPIRVMHLMGVRAVILTAAAGGMNPTFQVGDMMIIKDHFCLPAICGRSPLVGPNDDRFGPRFPIMQGTYSKEMASIFKAVAGDKIGRVREGVYAMIGGPSFSTDVETAFLRSVGADAVGMSVVWESMVARHCGMKVLAVAVITDVIGDYSHKVTLHEQVMDVANKTAADMTPMLEAVCERL